MRRLLQLTLPLALLVGCATQARFEEDVKSWEGKNVNDLITRIGPPSNTYQMPNGNTVYTFNRSQSGVTPLYVTPTQTTVTSYGNTAYASTTGGQVYGGQSFQKNCTINYTVDPRQIIIAWRYEGNYCRR